MANPSASDARGTSFLPDFCGGRTVVAVMVLAELFALVVTLAQAELNHLGPDAVRTSLFVQWNALSAVAALCVLRRPLARFTDVGAALISYLGLVLVTLAVSEAALFIDAFVAAPLVRSDGPEFVLRNLAVGATISALALRYFYVRKQWQDRTRTEAEARIAALQARIRPHFLFNSMNTIASLTREQPETAEQVVEDLSELFRASIGDGRRLATLTDELALARRYLEIERLRLGARLAVEWNIATGERTLLPPLTIQPLVENAVYHGIEPRAEGGAVRIDAARHGRRLEVTVSNPVPVAGGDSRGNQLAVDNIRQRLAAYFGHRAGLETGIEDNHYVARLWLPWGEDHARPDR